MFDNYSKSERAKRRLSKRRPPPRRCYPVLEQLEDRWLFATNITQYHVDYQSTGANLTETQLTSSNVNSADFGQLYSTPLDGQIYAEPLVLTNVTITGPNAGTYNSVVFVATQHDSLYAINAANGAILWQRTFLDLTNPNDYLPGATSVTTIPSGDTGSSDINPEIGITSTPVIDPSTNIIYVLPNTKEIVGGAAYYVQRLHAINIDNGTDAAPSFLIGSTTGSNENTNNTPIYVSGTGDGNVNGVVQFNALRENNRPALSLVNGEVYAEWASHGDNGPYHGWVVEWNVTNLSTQGMVLSGVLCTDPNGGEGGIWQGGGGLTFDPDEANTFYFETGNGDPRGGPPPLNAQGFPADDDYYEAVVKVVLDASTQANPNANGWGMHIVDYFTPSNVNALDDADEDFGSGAPLVLPDSAGIPGYPHLLVAAGKDGRIFLINRDDMGKFNATGDNVLNAVYNSSTGVYTAPTLINGSLSTPAYYHGVLYWVSGYSNDAEAFIIAPITNPTEPYDVATIAPISETANQDFGYVPGSVEVSANGDEDPADAVVWIMDNNNGELHAYSALSLSTELWNSGVGSLATVKFSTPDVANGQVFVGTQDNLTVFGLTGANTPAQAPNPVSNLSAQALSGSSVELTWTDSTVSPNFATNYAIQISTDNVHFTTVANAGQEATTYTVVGLTPNTTYYFQIVSSNSAGSSNPSSPSAGATTTTQTGATPTAPVGLGAVPASGSEVYLNWTNTATNETGFTLTRATNSLFTQNVVTETLASAPYYYTDAYPGLSPGNTYYYKIQATNSSGSSSSSNTASVTIPNVPAAPTNAAAVQSSNTIVVSWTDNAGPYALGYQISRSVDGGPYSIYADRPETSDAPPTTQTFTDTNVSLGHTYTYEIVAENVSGFSAPAYASSSILGVATLSLDNAGNLAYTVSPGAPDRVAIQLSGGVYTLTDSAVIITVMGAGAAAVTGAGSSTVTFPASAVSNMTLDTSDGADSISILSDAVPITITADSGGGDPTINLGAATGNSVISGNITNQSNGALSISGFGNTTITGNLINQGFGGVSLSGSGTINISGNINLGSGNLNDTDSGAATISGVISGSNAAVNGLYGQYFNLTAAANLIQPAAASNSSWLGTQTPAATAILTGAIDFPNISANGFQDNVGTTYYDIPGNNNVEGRWYGSILIPGTGATPVPITFRTGSDDGSTLYIDGNLVVNNNNFQSVTYVQNTINLTPGLHNIDIEYYQGGGGASMDAQWDPTGGSNFVDIPLSALFITSTSGVTMNGSGTLTLSNTNTYVGPTTINAGAVVVTADGALGPATAAGITVNAGGALALSGGLTYATAEPTTISGSGPAGSGAIVSLSGVNSFAAPITLAANATIGAAGGTLTLGGSTVSLAGNTLTFTGAGNLAVADSISGPTTASQVSQAGAGATTLSGNNTYAGLTSVTMGTLIADSPNALGSTVSGTVVAANATLGIEGGITLAAEPLTISGSGVSGVGALANLSGNNSFAGPISLAADSTIGASTAGATLTLTGNITNGNAFLASNLTFTGAGNVTVNGVIQASPAVAGLLGDYYSNLPGFNNAANQNLLITSTNPAWLGNPANDYVPGATALLTGAIDFPNIATNGFTDNLGTTYVNFGNNNMNVDARWVGMINIPNNGVAGNPISFGTGSDDGSVIYIDGNLVVNNNAYQGNGTYPALQVKNTVNLTPGLHTIDIEYYNGNGGASVWAQWDPTGGTNFVDISNSVFTYQPPGIGNVVKNGSGTVTLAATNTYTGSTTVNGGTLRVSSDANLGATASSPVTINAGTLEATATFISAHPYVVGAPTSTILVDATKTLTLTNTITGSGTLNQAGTGILALTGNNSYSGGTTIPTGGTVAVTGNSTLGVGTVNLSGGTLQLNGGQTQETPLAVTGFNQDVVWANSEANSQVGTTTAFDGGGGHVFYQAGAPFSPGGGLPQSGTFNSQANSAVTFGLQPYTANNVLYSTDTNNYTLTLSNPGAFQDLSILDAAANGASTFNITLNFASGAPTIFSAQTAPDWFTGGTGTALSGLGEITRATSGLSYLGLPNNPNLYELDLTLATADQSRTLTSITFTQTGTPTDLGVFAVSGRLSAPAQTYVNSVAVTDNSTIDVENTPATLGTLSIGSSTLSVTTAGAATSLTLGATTLTGNPTFSPGANTSLTLGALNDGGTPRTISVTGPTTLAAPATSLVNGTIVDVTASVLNSNNATALGSLAAVAVSTGASFNLGASQTVGALSGPGNVNLDGNTLTVGSTNNLSSTFSGAVGDGTGTAGSGGLVKAGSGTWTIAAGSTDSYTGPTADNAGTLVVNGSLTASTATVASGATLRGTGTVFHVAAASGGQVEPGGGPGTLTTSSLALASGSTFTVELGGTGAGQYDQAVVSAGGTVNLNSNSGVAGAKLALTTINGFLPAVGNTFTIINNQGTNSVAGTFVQGPTYSANGYTYSISYTGGTKNDSVVLTVTGVPSLVNHFQVVASPTSVIAGAPGAVSYTVTALDANNNIVPTYTGTVAFTSTDGQAVFPVNNYTFTSGGLTSDDGVHTFTATLETAGNQTITATDLSNNTGTTNAVMVTAGAFSKYVVSIPGGSTVTAGSSFLFTVQAADPYGNTVSSYSGPSSVAVAVSPANSPGTIPTSIPLNSAGFGFSLGTLTQVGSSYTLNVTGTQGNNTYTGTSSAITVTPAAATHFVVTAPSSTLTLNSTNFTVTAEDQYNNVATGYSGTVAFTSSDGAVSTGSGLPINSTLVNGTGTFTATLKTPGNQTITATDASNSALVGNSNAIATRGLYVSSFATTPSGFTATFSKVVNLTTFDYYRFSASQSQAPDVAMATVGSATTNVNGTLLVSSTATQTTITFVATQGVLTNAAKYFVTLTSGAGGIVDTSGEQLAGDANGFLPGTNYVVTNLAPASSTTPTLSIPGFARGPNSSAAVQITTNSVSAAGIPITLTHAPASTTEVQFTLDFNPALLNVTGPTSGNLQLLNPSTANSTGVANFEYSGPALSTTSAVLGDIVADVPNSAANQMLQKTLLDLPAADIFFNGSATPASPVQNADGVQVVDYLGETTNNFGVINSVDASNAQAVVTANTTPTTANQPAGLQAFPLADPYLIAGSTGSTTFKVVAADVTGLNRFAVSLSHPFIPTPPTGLTYSSPGPDPTLSLPTNLQVTAGGIVTVPVDIDDPRPAGSDGMTQAELALTYNPAVFSLTSADVQLGTVPASGTGWTLTTQINPLTGQIAILLESQTPIRSAAGGSLVSIDFHVNPGATLGATPVNLAASVNPTGNAVVWTRLFDSQQEFTLSPAPSNTVSAAGIDAMVVVTPVDAGTAEGAGSNLGAPAEIGSVISAPTLLPELTAAVAPVVVPEEDKQGIAAPVDELVAEGQTVHASGSADRTGSSVLEAVPFSANAGTTVASATSGLMLPWSNTAASPAAVAAAFAVESENAPLAENPLVGAEQSTRNGAAFTAASQGAVLPFVAQLTTNAPVGIQSRVEWTDQALPSWLYAQGGVASGVGLTDQVFSTLGLPSKEADESLLWRVRLQDLLLRDDAAWLLDPWATTSGQDLDATARAVVGDPTPTVAQEQSDRCFESLAVQADPILPCVAGRPTSSIAASASE